MTFYNIGISVYISTENLNEPVAYIFQIQNYPPARCTIQVSRFPRKTPRRSFRNYTVRQRNENRTYWYSREQFQHDYFTISRDYSTLKILSNIDLPRIKNADFSVLIFILETKRNIHPRAAKPKE